MAAFCLPASAEVTIKNVSGPYGNFAVEGVWVQRVVTLANYGDQPRLMKFGLITNDPTGGQRQYTRILQVPPGSMRKATVAYRPGRLKRLKAIGRSGPNRPAFCEQLYLLEDVEAGKRIPQQAQQTTRIPASVTTVSFVSDKRPIGDSPAHMRNMPGGELGTVQLVSERIRQLPDVWYGYSMVDLLIFGSVDISQLRPTQIDAVLDWVQRGGLLIVAGGRSMDQMLRGRLGRAAGVAVIGIHDAVDLAVDGPGLRSVKVTLAQALPMAELQTVQAAVVYRANGLPLLTSRAFGHGNVLTLSLPIGGLADTKLHRIWSEVRDIGRSLPPLDANRFLSAGRDTLQQIAGRRGATRKAPVAILLALAGFVVIAGAALKFVRRGELVWLGLIPLAVIISVALYAYGQTLRDSQRLRHIGLVSGLGDDRARVQEAFAYYSGPEVRRMDFSANSPRGLISNIGAQATGTTAETRTMNGTDLPNITVRNNDTAAFYVDSIDPTAALKTNLTFTADGLVGEITNLLPEKIEDAVLYADGLSYQLGTLPAGKQTKVEINAGKQLARGEFTGSGEIKPRRNELVQAMISRQSTGKKGRNGPGRRRAIRSWPLLIGYTPYSPLDPLPGRKLERDGWCVLTWPIRTVAPPSGTKVTIPAGLVRVEQLGSLRDVTTGGYQQTRYGGSLEMKVAPPESIRALRDVTATISVGISATNFQLIVSGGQLNNHGVVVPLTVVRTIDNPSGLYKVTIPKADRFTAGNGQLLFHIRIKRLDEGNTSDLMARTMKAKVHSVQIALKGTVL